MNEAQRGSEVNLAPEDPAELRGYLATMMRIRLFERKAMDAFSSGLLIGMCHSSEGEEAVAVGACAALREDDYILSTHRGHGHCIAKGGDLKRMMAELFGKEAGYCKGRGGSMHIAGPEFGHLGANGIVGGGLPIACGVGLSIKLRRTDQVVACFFGDAASNTGSFHEALNLASLRAMKLPVIFICENNLYGLSTPIEYSSAVPNVADRATAYDMPGVIVYGQDVLAVREAVNAAAGRARAGQGPTLIEAKTYRYTGHSKSDTRPYRTREEEAAWQARDPIENFASHLLRAGFITEADIERMWQETEAEVKEAVEYARRSPDPKPEDRFEYVYA